MAFDSHGSDHEEPSDLAGKVFAVPELCEAIILQLPNRDLLRIRRLNKTTHLTIKESPRIQEKLFFRLPSDNKHGPLINPLLNRILKVTDHTDGCLFTWEIIDEEEGKRLHLFHSGGFRINPPECHRTIDKMLERPDKPSWMHM